MKILSCLQSLECGVDQVEPFKMPIFDDENAFQAEIRSTHNRRSLAPDGGCATKSCRSISSMVIAGIAMGALCGLALVVLRLVLCGLL